MDQEAADLEIELYKEQKKLLDIYDAATMESLEAMEGNKNIIILVQRAH